MADTTELLDDEMIDPVTGGIIDQKDLAERCLAQAKEQGVSLVGLGGPLNLFTKNVLETALNAELSEHLGHVHDGTPIGENMRNGTRTKTMLTEIGPVEIEVPRDREGSFAPVIGPKRKRRLDGIDQIVLSLTARGLTTEEIAAHFDEVYGAKVSKDMISRITEKVTGELAEWSSGPLDAIYPGISVDVIVVKVRDGKARNTPFYVMMGITMNGERDILSIWAGNGAERDEVLAVGVQRAEQPRGRGRTDRSVRRFKGLPEASNTTWEQAAKDQFTEFAAEWGERYPAIVHLWRSSWAKFVPFLEYDVEIRQVICTTNAIKSINARYRRAVRARGHFPNKAAAIKCLYLVTQSLDPTGGGKARWVMRSKPALNAFAITLTGRLEKTTHE